MTNSLSTFDGWFVFGFPPLDVYRLIKINDRYGYEC